MKNLKFVFIFVFLGLFPTQVQADDPLSGLNKSRSTLQSESASMQPDQKWLDLAVEANASENHNEAIGYYQIAEQSGDAWTAWAGISGQVATYRMMDQPEKALEITRQVAKERPELAGLMLIWDADTQGLNANAELALATYLRAVEDYGYDNIDGKPVGALALKQLSFAYLHLGQPWEAAQSLRRQLLEFPTDEDPDLTVARVFTYEALAHSPDFPIYSLGTLVEAGICSFEKRCVIENGNIKVAQEAPSHATSLAKLDGFYFVLSKRESDFLQKAREASESTGRTYSSPSSSYATSCTPNNATNGFQNPYSASFVGYGDVYMSYPAAAGGYHPGVDYNTTDDCNDKFLATAQGCVTEVAAVYPTRLTSTSTWGTMTVKHYYYPAQSSTAYWTSQYGHGDTAYYSVYSAVSKGATLGDMNGIPNYSCHLHFEIREYDHAARSDADYWNTSSQTTVGDYYQDPVAFINAHTNYTRIIWGDENNFTTYGTTAWSSSTTVGDEDYLSSAAATDMKYVTRASSKTAYARAFFTPTSSGTYYLYAFVPWNNATSISVPYSIVRNSSGSVVLSQSKNQLYGSSGTAGYGCGTTYLTPSWVTYQGMLCDEWLYVGSASLTSGVQYYVEVANNTGSTDSATAKVGLDDILLIKR